MSSAGIPDWKVKLTQGWESDKFGVQISQRWISDGVYSNEYIECQTNCPVSTVTRQTIDNNQMKGALYVDVGGTYRATDNVSAYFTVDNVLNKDPEPAPGTTVSLGLNPYLYDALGAHVSRRLPNQLLTSEPATTNRRRSREAIPGGSRPMGSALVLTVLAVDSV